MKKRILALLLATTMAASLLVGCGAKTDTPAADDKATTAPAPADDTAKTDDGATTDETVAEKPASTGDKIISVNLAGSPETLDPHKNSALDGGNYLIHLFEGLMRYKRDGSGVELGAAEKMDISEDGMTYTFTLRKDSKWSDGQPLTAKDFVYSFRRLVDPATAAPYATDMGQYMLNAPEIIAGTKPIEELGVTAIDDTTLEVKLGAPTTFFKELLAFPTYVPLRQDIIEANGDRWATDASTYISNGAFKMSEYVMDSNLTFVRNENYWDAASIIPDGINCLLIADNNATLAAYRANEIQLAETVPEEEEETLKAEGVWAYYPQLGTYYVDFNNTVKPFDNVLVRKAFTLAIDRDFIANTVRQGNVAPADGFVGEGFMDVAEGSDFRATGGTVLDISNYEANKEAAKAALAEAGFPEGKGFPSVEYMYNNGVGHETVAQALQGMWKEVLGVEVSLVPQEWGVFTETRRLGDYTMARDGWIADFNDPIAMLSIMDSASGNNNAKYNSKAFDDYLNIAKTSTDQAARMEAMHKAETLMMTEDFAVAALYYYKDGVLISPELKNVGLMPLGFKMFYLATLDSWN